MVLPDTLNPADEGHPIVLEPWLHDPVTWHDTTPPGWMEDLYWFQYYETMGLYDLD